MSVKDFQTTDEIVIKVRGRDRPDEAAKPKQLGPLIPSKPDEGIFRRRSNTPTAYSWRDCEEITIGFISPFTGNRWQYFPKGIGEDGIAFGGQILDDFQVANVWRDGAKVVLAAGGSNSVANAIAGDLVAGLQQFATFDIRAYTNVIGGTNTFLQRYLTPPPQGIVNVAFGIGGGIVVGISNPNFLYPEGISDFVLQALRWDGSLYTEIFPGGTSNSCAYAVNEDGVIVGRQGDAAFIKSPTAGLSYIAGGRMARKINNLGHVIGGHGSGFDDLPDRSFFWDGSDFTDIGETGLLDTSNAAYTTGAQDLNDSDQVVGTMNLTGSVDDQIPFLWDPVNGLVDINTLLPEGSTLVLTQAWGINNARSIVCVGYDTTQGLENRYWQRAYIGTLG